MLFERIISAAISHLSYFLADDSKALVIDPRADIEIYLKLARENNLQITNILETHRHEDFICGSTSLAKSTGAEIWHADSQWDYGFGFPVSDNQTWNIGKLKLESIYTPGHTPGQMSYLLYDDHGAPWCVFTGDTLFSGEVGRVDLMATDRLEEMASLLYDSIFSKLLLLGDQIIVCPAHGAGSICGRNISSRLWTTIGLERLHNPALQLPNRTSFINTVARNLEMPPYFKMMERLNLSDQIPEFINPAAYPSQEFNDMIGDSLVLDTRETSCFTTSHIPNSISIWAQGVPSYAGWFLPYDISLFLVGSNQQLDSTLIDLFRLGYSVKGYLSEDFIDWHKAGLPTNSIPTITAEDLKTQLDSSNSLWILDVRSSQELADDGKIPGANHIPITELTSQIDLIPIDRNIYIICDSGHRSTTAASLLLQQGPYKPVVILGGFSSWKSLKYPLEH
jgi:hydroxyacylglutathione hydrolase